MVLPEKFTVEVIDWSYADRLCRRVRTQVRETGYEPDAVLGVARGGWFAARCLSDLLAVSDLLSISIDHYGEDTAGDSGVNVLDAPPEERVSGARVLLVDDSVDSGKTIERGAEYLDGTSCREYRTAVLQRFEDQPPDLDYVGTTFDDWRFVVNPWEFTENMTDMINGVLVKEGVSRFDRSDVYDLLEEYHDLSKADLEVAQPNRIDEVLREMETRGITAESEDGAWRLTDSGRERYESL